jgi:hypothetical protein
MQCVKLSFWNSLTPRPAVATNNAKGAAKEMRTRGTVRGPGRSCLEGSLKFGRTVTFGSSNQTV